MTAAWNLSATRVCGEVLAVGRGTGELSDGTIFGLGMSLLVDGELQQQDHLASSLYGC